MSSITPLRHWCGYNTRRCSKRAIAMVECLVVAVHSGLQIHGKCSSNGGLEKQMDLRFNYSTLALDIASGNVTQSALVFIQSLFTATCWLCWRPGRNY